MKEVDCEIEGARTHCTDAVKVCAIIARVESETAKAKQRGLAAADNFIELLSACILCICRGVLF